VILIGGFTRLPMTMAVLAGMMTWWLQAVSAG
jgi:hypothetical protein